MQNIPIKNLITLSEFNKLFNEMIPEEKIGEIVERYHSGRGAPCKFTAGEIIMGSVYHEIQSVGTLGEHTRQVTGKVISDGGISQRRQGMDLKVFKFIIHEGLVPRAVAGKHPEAFYHGLRLVGIDGTEFSVPNTDSIEEEIEKAASWKGVVGFAKIGLCMISELALHNPIGAAIGWEESEMSLAKKVFEQIPPGSLLLGDRYYGVNKCISELIGLGLPKDNHFLFRVRSNLNSRLIQKFSDGSALMEIERWDDKTKIQLREIRGKVRARNGKKIEVRLWTGLLDEKKYPARELLKLYGQRWEQEIMTDELKNKLHGGSLLKSQTPQTAVQELTAMLIAQAMVVRVRMTVAQHLKLPTLRVSFGKTLVQIQALWLFFEIGEGILSPKQTQAFTQRALEVIARQILPKRRNRSCPRAVRKPLGPWPKLKKNSYQHGEFQYEIIPVS